MSNNTPAADAVSLPEPSAHMYPSDLERFETSETFAQAYSVAVGCPDERSVPLFTLSKLTEYATDRESALVAERDALRAAAQAVLAWRVGDLPTLGHLRDNDASRFALAQLAALAAPAVEG